MAPHIKDEIDPSETTATSDALNLTGSGGKLTPLTIPEPSGLSDSKPTNPGTPTFPHHVRHNKPTNPWTVLRTKMLSDDQGASNIPIEYDATNFTSYQKVKEQFGEEEIMEQFASDGEDTRKEAGGLLEMLLEDLTQTCERAYNGLSEVWAELG